MYLQKVIIAAAVVLAPAVAVDDPEPNSPAQGWDSSRLGQRGFTVCPEPNMQEPGKRVKVDFCQNYVTSETYVKCRAFPTFNNNKGFEPRVSIHVDASNTCILFTGTNCQKRGKGFKYYTVDAHNKVNGTVVNDVYLAMGNTNTSIAQRIMCSMKGADHALSNIIDADE